MKYTCCGAPVRTGQRNQSQPTPRCLTHQIPRPLHSWGPPYNPQTSTCLPQCPSTPKANTPLTLQSCQVLAVQPPDFRVPRQTLFPCLGLSHQQFLLEVLLVLDATCTEWPAGLPPRPDTLQAWVVSPVPRHSSPAEAISKVLCSAVRVLTWLAQKRRGHHSSSQRAASAVSVCLSVCVCV